MNLEVTVVEGKVLIIFTEKPEIKNVVRKMKRKKID